MIAERRSAEISALSSSNGPALSSSNGPPSLPAAFAADPVQEPRPERQPIPAAFAADTVEGMHAELGPARPWIYLTILGLASTALVALPLVRVDVTFAAPGQVRAAAERSEIRAAVSGRIAHLWVGDNTPVEAAEPLLELDAQAVDARLAHNRARQQRARDVLRDLELLSAAVDGVAVFHHRPTSSAAADHYLFSRGSERQQGDWPQADLRLSSEISNFKSQIPAPLPSPLSPVSSTLLRGSERQRGDWPQADLRLSSEISNFKSQIPAPLPSPLSPSPLPLPLAWIFQTHERNSHRNIHPPCGRSDFVAASPDKVGPTGRTFHTSACEMFGLAPLPETRPLASFGSAQDPLRFQVSSFRFLRDFGSLPSPAAETGAVAAEVHESSAAGARLKLSNLRFEISDQHNAIPAASGPSLLAEISHLKPEMPAAIPAPQAPAPAFLTAEIAAEHADYSARRAALRLAAARARAESERVSLLHDRGLVSRRDQDEARFALERAAAEVEILRQQSLARWQSRRRDEELALIALVSEEAHLGDERTSFTVAAPLAGTVLGLGGLAAGAWVAAGQTLGVISPDDALLVEAAVPPHRIGLLRPGQAVRLAIDTYAPTVWGTAGGRIVEISDDLLAHSAGAPFYRVLIALDATELRRTDGALAPLRKGMTAQARFHLARRSLLELLHENTSRWLDPRRA